MRNLCKMVGVTYGEFQSWYNYGEIRICYNRIVTLETTTEGEPDPVSPNVSILLERIPQLNLEDEEGILLIQLKPVDIKISNYEIDPQTIYLPIDCIQSIIPLTERAGRILGTRIGSFGVNLSPAYFHQQVRETWFRFGVRKALRGGDTLVRALFENGLQVIDETLRKSIEFGIWELDYSKDCSKPDTSNSNITLIAKSFKYTRRELFKYGDLDYMLDAGLVLNEAFKSEDEEKSPRLQPFRDVLEKAIGKKASLVDVFKNVEWIQTINKMEHDLLDSTPVGLISLVLFLRWKERFHKMNQEVDFIKLKEEAADCAGSINFDNTVSAVWMFGCFVGYENVAPIVYATPEMSSFSSLTEPRFTDKIFKPETPSFLEDATKADVDSLEVPEDDAKAEAVSDEGLKESVSAEDGANPETNKEEEVTENATKAVKDSAEDIKESVSNEDAPPKKDTVEVTEDATKAVKDSAEDIKESVSNEDAPPKTDTVEVTEDATKAAKDSTREVKKASKPEPNPDPELVVEATKPKEHRPVEVGKIAQSVKTAEMQTVDEEKEPVEVIAKEQEEAQIPEGQVKENESGRQKNLLTE